MKAMRLTGLRSMERQETPTPDLAHPGDVRVRMAVVGVCGSDVHYYEEGRIGGQVVRYPFTVGHEGAGIVEAIGAAVTRVKPGDRIALEPAQACGTCDQCLASRPHTCRKLRFLGCPGQADWSSPALSTTATGSSPPSCTADRSAAASATARCMSTTSWPS